MTDPFMYDQIDFAHMTEAVTAALGRSIEVFCLRPTVAEGWLPDPRFLVRDFGKTYKTKEPLSGHHIDESITAIITELQQRDEDRRLRQEQS